jgi:nicotinate phosphoribosyltransferase
MIEQSPLLTDLYQLAMLEAYDAHGMSDTAVFELFVRRLPPQRGFLIAAGLEPAISFLESMRFSPKDLAWLQGTGLFSQRFLRQLVDMRFTGDVDAMPEGSVFFPDEPILRVTAPLPQAQLVETRLLNLVHFQTVIASKAVRMVLAAPGRQLVDFGLRRAHGAEAGLLAARAAYLAGFAGSSNVLANCWFGVPMMGTMAHSYVQAHEDEATAFERFARIRPQLLTLLIDTFDTECGARIVAALAPKLAVQGIQISAVRLDSGDLGVHARAVRAILDAAGLHEIRIFASGGLDEYALLGFSRDQVPIDGFGIGTSLTTSSDAPALDCAYKLQEYAGTPRRKLSEGKATWPGRKQVYRRYHDDGTIAGDIVALSDEAAPGEALLVPAMRNGKRVYGVADLPAARAHTAASLVTLPKKLRSLESHHVLVQISHGIRRMAEHMDTAHASAMCHE